MPTLAPGLPAIPTSVEVALSSPASHSPVASFIARYEPRFIDDLPAFHAALTAALHAYGKEAQAITTGLEADQRRADLEAVREAIGTGS